MADYSFISQNQQTPALQNLQGIMSVAQKAQEIQQAGMELQRQRQMNQERIDTQQFMSTPENWQTDGKIDLGKLNSSLTKIAPLTGADTIGKLSTLSTAETQASAAQQNLTQQQRAIVAGPLNVLGQRGEQNPAAYEQVLDNVIKTNPGNKDLSSMVDAYKTIIKTLPAGQHLPQLAITASQSLMTPAEQQGSLTPTAGLTNTGGALNETITTPAVGGNPPNVSMTGRTQPLTLPPTTQQFNTDTNAPETVGTTAGGEHVQTGPALGVPETTAGIVKNAAEDWTQTQASAKNAAQDIGVLQEIKKYAPNAITGVGGAQRQLVAGFTGWLANKLGMDVGQLEKTDTDLLAKNSQMLALAGGDTNLAKSMAEAANPNTHMTAQAIAKAANQVMAQRQLAVERQNFLLPYVSDPKEYQKKSAQFNSIADPRILQLPNMSVQEKVDMKKAMSPGEQKDFSNKIREMQKLGILR